jgi:hypothetical protein
VLKPAYPGARVALFQGNEAMYFKEISNDILFPDTGIVPKVNKWGNHAITIRYTPSNSTRRLHGSGGIAKPIIMAGTKHYQPTFIKMTKLAQELSTLGSFPQPYLHVGDAFAKCPDFAVAIMEDNIIECLTICTYIHDLKHVVEFQNILLGQAP